jgi:flagellin
MSMTLGLNSTTYAMLFNLNNLDSARESTMTKLSTGQRINKAADDPSGLVVLTGLNADMARINTAIENNERSQAVLNTADATLMTIGDLVKEIENAVISASNPNASSAEVAAYQATVDQSLDAIDSMLSTAAFNGTKLFEGNYEINPTVTDTSNLISDENVYIRDATATAATNITVTNAGGNTAVTVNGTTVALGAAVAGETYNYTVDGFTGSFTMTSASNGTATISVAASGGATFQLGTDASTQVAMDLGAGMTTTALGDSVGGYLSTLRSGGTNDLSSGNSTTAQDIVSKASRQVAMGAARLGNFNKFQIGSSLKALEAMKEGTADLISSIQDTDYAAETAELDRQNILMQAAVSMLATSNSTQANVLTLLR